MPLPQAFRPVSRKNAGSPRYLSIDAHLPLEEITRLTQLEIQKLNAQKSGLAERRLRNFTQYLNLFQAQHRTTPLLHYIALNCTLPAPSELQAQTIPTLIQSTPPNSLFFYWRDNHPIQRPRVNNYIHLLLFALSHPQSPTIPPNPQPPIQPAPSQQPPPLVPHNGLSSSP